MNSEQNNEHALPRRELILFWLAFALIWIISLATRALIHADEGRYAEIPLEMLRSSDWVTPRLNGFLYFEKPALQYWMTTLAYSLFGVNEFAARLWTGLSGLASIAMVGYSAGQLWGRISGMYAGMAAGSMCWMISNGHFLSLDMGLTFCLTVALCAMLLATRQTLNNRQRTLWMAVCWAAVAGAILSKGLVGLVIPGASLVLYSLLGRDFSLWPRLRWGWGLVIVLALCLPWFILVSQRNPGFAQFFFIHEHLERYLTTTHQRTGSIWYFVPVLLFGLLPWTGLLWSACAKGWQEKSPPIRQQTRLLLCWCGFIFVFFSLSSSKLQSYILPMFPALALLLGRLLSMLEIKKLQRALLIPILAWVALGLVGSVIKRPDIPPHLLAPLVKAFSVAACVFVLLAAWAWLLLKHGRRAQGIALLSLASLISVSIAMQGHDGYAKLKTSRELVKVIKPHLQAQMPVYSVATYDQTFSWYLGRTVTLVQYIDEFEFGQSQEPTRAIATIALFKQRWQQDAAAMAFMNTDIFEQLRREHLPMRVIFLDQRRVVVIKP